VVVVTQNIPEEKRKRQFEIKLTKNREEKAQELLEDGYNFECESLSNGQVIFFIKEGEKIISSEQIIKGLAAVELFGKMLDDF
jgi:high-affinity K+ transport system ATPase subunit B